MVRNAGRGVRQRGIGVQSVSAAGTYSGYGYAPIGDKARFVLPAAFRKEVKDSSGGSKTLCLKVHDKHDCLVGFGTSRIETLKQRLANEQAAAIEARDRDFDYDELAQLLFGFEQLPFDDSGRFNMPDHLRELGNVGDGLFCQGAGDFFLIWNPEELYKMGPAYRAAQAACRKLVAEAEAKAAKKGGK